MRAPSTAFAILRWTKMRIKGVLDEDFVNYKLPAMVISSCTCSFKCEKESGIDCCQNGNLVHSETLNVPDGYLIERYQSNPITKAIVIGGLEPFDQWEELYGFISRLRVDYGCGDDVVIYTGYNRDEIEGEILMLCGFDNIVVKFGRFIPGCEPHDDKVLGVKLASDNQYAERIS